MTCSVVFDLDFCLFRTRSMKRGLVPVIRNYIKSEDVLRVHDEKTLISFIWDNAPDVVVAEYRLNEVERERFLSFYAGLPVPPGATLYGDVFPVLNELKVRNVRMYLLTKGERPFQLRKVAHLGISEYFEEVIVVGSRCQVKTKHDALGELIERRGLSTLDTWVVGDGPEELKAGLALRCQTVQTLRAKVNRFDGAAYHINALPKLLPLLGVR